MGLVYKYQQLLECQHCGYRRTLEHWDRLYAFHDWKCPKCRDHNESEEAYYVLRGTKWAIPADSQLAWVVIHAPTSILGFLGIGTCLVYILKLLLAGPFSAQQFLIGILQGSSSGYAGILIIFSMFYFMIRAVEVIVFRKSSKNILGMGHI